VLNVGTNGYRPNDALDQPSEDPGQAVDRLDAHDRESRQNEPGSIEFSVRNPRPRILIGVIVIIFGLVGLAILLLNSTNRMPALPGVVASQTAQKVDPIDQAIREIQDQETVLAEARVQHILATAKVRAERNRTTIEQELHEQLRIQTKQLYQVSANGALTGNATDVAQGRALLGDARAILLALQSVHARSKPSEGGSIRLGTAASLIEQIEQPATMERQRQ
jgi:hypothetical protein